MQGPLSAGPREPAPRWDTPQMAPVPTAHAASSRQTPGPKASPAPHPDLLTCVGPRPSGRPRAGLGGLCWSARQPSDQADQAEDLHTSGRRVPTPGGHQPARDRDQSQGSTENTSLLRRDFAEEEECSAKFIPKAKHILTRATPVLPILARKRADHPKTSPGENTLPSSEEPCLSGQHGTLSSSTCH